MYKVDACSQAIYEESAQAVNILDSVTVPEHYILATTINPNSTLDVRRKQGYTNYLPVYLMNSSTSSIY